MSPYFEANFDGLVGPTHNYSGLSFGNVASTQSRAMPSNPREAALQGVAKMRLLSSLGIRQGFFLPHERPFFPFLRAIGFQGAPPDLIKNAARDVPQLFHASCSSSFMWAANAATMTPSCDSSDQKAHFTPANLSANLHRSLETPFTAKQLRLLFQDAHRFVHHPSLPPSDALSDEGSANHTRFFNKEHALHLFVYGRSTIAPGNLPKHYPARQTLEASQAIARSHGISENNVLLIQQNPEAVDAGVFHNDVISVGHRQLFLYHESAFVDTPGVIQQLLNHLPTLLPICVPKSIIPIEEAVKTYLFNSQLVSSTSGEIHLIAPIECKISKNVHAFLQNLTPTPLYQVHYIDLRESMRNGGGPACLRCRIVLNEEEWKCTHPSFIFTPEKDNLLTQWIQTHYRDHLEPGDLADPQLLNESYQALDQLTQLLNLGSIYDFQR